MPVAGLVVTLFPQHALRTAAVQALAAHPQITLGDLQSDGRLPIVTETDDLKGQSALWEEIARVPGVMNVDLAYHDFSDIDRLESADVPRRVRREGDSQ